MIFNSNNADIRSELFLNCITFYTIKTSRVIIISEEKIYKLKLCITNDTHGNLKQKDDSFLEKIIKNFVFSNNYRIYYNKLNNLI